MPAVIYQQGVFLPDWPFGAAIAFIMLFAILALFFGAYPADGRKRLAAMILWLVCIAILLYLIAPIVVMVATAFGTTGYPVFPPVGFTL